MDSGREEPMYQAGETDFLYSRCALGVGREGMLCPDLCLNKVPLVTGQFEEGRVEWQGRPKLLH